MKFLVIDDNPDHRFLLSKTLRRKFPDAVLLEAQSIETVITALQASDIDLVVAHRTQELRGAALITELRQLDAGIPIIAVSSMAQGGEMIAAGATRFHLIDEWLLIGNAAGDLLRRQSAPPWPGSS